MSSILDKTPLRMFKRNPAAAAESNPPKPTANDVQKNSICNTCKYGFVTLARDRWGVDETPVLSIACCHPALHHEVSVFGVQSCNGHEDGEFCEMPFAAEEQYDDVGSQWLLDTLSKAVKTQSSPKSDADKSIEELLAELESEETLEVLAAAASKKKKKAADAKKALDMNDDADDADYNEDADDVDGADDVDDNDDDGEDSDEDEGKDKDSHKG